MPLVDRGVAGDEIEEFAVVHIVEVDAFAAVDYDGVRFVVVAAVF